MVVYSDGGFVGCEFCWSRFVVGLWVMILKSNSREWWDLEDGGDQWVFKLEISGFVGSNLWVCKSVSGFDFGWCMLIFGFWILVGVCWFLDFGWCMVIKKVLETQRKEKKIRINLLRHEEHEQSWEEHKEHKHKHDLPTRKESLLFNHYLNN